MHAPTMLHNDQELTQSIHLLCCQQVARVLRLCERSFSFFSETEGSGGPYQMAPVQDRARISTRTGLLWNVNSRTLP